MGCCSSKSSNEKAIREWVASSSPDLYKSLTDLDLAVVPRKGLITGRFPARVMRVYDGDTFTVAVSLDGITFQAHQIRLYGCDTPEAKGNTKIAGLRAKEETLRFMGADGAIGKRNGKEMNAWFQSNPVIITIEFIGGTPDKYGRDLGKVWVNDRRIDLTTHLLETKNAYPYQGGTKDQTQYEE